MGKIPCFSAVGREISRILGVPFFPPEAYTVSVPKRMDGAMELIVISDLQIKLTLTRDDLGKYPPNAETGEIFRKILHDAGQLARDKSGAAPLPDGFEHGGGGRLYVQIYPSRGGGCELFVTRLPLCAADGRGEAGYLEEGKESLFRPVVIPSPARRYVYAFDSLGLLLRCCAGLSSMPRADAEETFGTAPLWADSAAYFSRDRRLCYLVLSEDTPAVGEYLGALCPDGTYAYINEHCTLLCSGNAVVKLGELA